MTGLTFDGSQRLPQPLSFTKRTDVHALFARVSGTIVDRLESAGVALNDNVLTSLVFKLAAHCSKAGWQTVERIQKLDDLVPMIVDALVEKPEVLTDRINLKAILDGHLMRASQRAAALQVTERHGDAAPIVLATASDPSYVLVELTTPAHLQTESTHLGHCVGTLFNKKALAGKGLTEKHPAALDCLHYSIKMRQQKTRIFSLRHKGKPCATIEYETASADIVQIEGNPREISVTAPFFPALCELLGALWTRIPLNRIVGLPPMSDNEVLTTRGHLTTYTPELATQILAGKLVVDADIPADELNILCRLPLSLDVTSLDLSRLPSDVKADLLSSAIQFDAPQLQNAAEIYAGSATGFHAPQLQTAHRIYAGIATSFHAPQLRNAHDIYADSATSFHAPQLQTARCMYARSASSFHAPQLQIAHDIDATSAASFDAPQLKTVHDIYARSAVSFYAQQLQTARDIHARGATSFHAAQLQTAHRIYAGSATSFHVPQLQTVHYIDAGCAIRGEAPMPPSPGFSTNLHL